MLFPKIILSLASLGGAVVIGALLVYPEYKSFQDLESKVIEKNSELKSQSEYFAKLTGISKDLKKYEVQLSKIDEALPESVSIPALLDAVQSKASKAGLVIKETNSVFVRSNASNPRLKDIGVSVVFSGTYSSLKQFISDLEASSKLFTIERISFSYPANGPFQFKLLIITNSY